MVKMTANEVIAPILADSAGGGLGNAHPSLKVAVKKVTWVFEIKIFFIDGGKKKVIFFIDRLKVAVKKKSTV